MLPGDMLSPDPHVAAFVEPVNVWDTPLVDVEVGGVALNDPSGGLEVQLWTANYAAPDVTVSAPSVPSSVLFSLPDITQISLAFDQNMRPFVAFVQGGQARYWWFDTAVGSQVFSDLPVDARYPRATLDDKRLLQRIRSDIILAYTRGTGLYYRQQRDRFQTERLLKDPCGGDLESIGMNAQRYLQFRIRPSIP